MNTYRKNAIIVGVLFLTATVMGMLADSLVGSILNVQDYLMNVYPNRIQLITGVLITFILGLAVIGIAIFLFPVLKKQSEPLALGYAGIRIAEFPILLVWSISPLLLITISQEIVTAGDTEASSFQSFGDVLIGLRYWTWLLVYIINGIATLILACLLYQSLLVPRPISVLGLIGGVVLILGTAIAMMSSHVDVNQGIGLLAVVPGGLFELILPIWLLVKGFDLSALNSDYAKTDINEAV